ncbi:type II methionyl aminopeptidase [Candidatus Micrarchaeota archaeon]|nr:type II methionyl aminopeptidase [Candidatus Micrarchaeota archaeon]
MEEDAELIKNFKEAGRIAELIRKESLKLVIPGQPVLDIAETLEQMIVENGGRPGFPVNVSINHIAAHYTPSSDETTTINDNDIVKIDFGVHINGCISDNAITIDLSDEHGDLVEASKLALDNALSTMRAGKTVGEIGKVIEDTITSKGFKPIRNLTGHMIRPYQLHAGEIIPNVATEDGYVLKEGDVFAVEPFATTGEGRVKDSNRIEIYSIAEIKNVRLRKSREIFAYAFEHYFTLPFARRWLDKIFGSKVLVSLSLRELVNADMLYQYPVLEEVKGGLVSQAERTVLIEKDSVTLL